MFVAAVFFLGFWEGFSGPNLNIGAEYMHGEAPSGYIGITFRFGKVYRPERVRQRVRNFD